MFLALVSHSPSHCFFNFCPLSLFSCLWQINLSITVNFLRHAMCCASFITGIDDYWEFCSKISVRIAQLLKLAKNYYWYTAEHSVTTKHVEWEKMKSPNDYFFCLGNFLPWFAHFLSASLSGPRRRDNRASQTYTDTASDYIQPAWTKRELFIVIS